MVRHGVEQGPALSRPLTTGVAALRRRAGPHGDDEESGSRDEGHLFFAAGRCRAAGHLSHLALPCAADGDRHCAGLGLGIAEVALRIAGNAVSVATVVLVALLLIFGSQFTLFAMWFDMESNKDLR